MRKRLLIIAAILVTATLPAKLSAQQEMPVKFGEVSPKDFNLPLSPVVNANAKAVIIADMGTLDFKGDNKGFLSYVLVVKRRALILHQTALDDLTKITIGLRSNAKSALFNDVLSDLQCFTYNLENGQVQQTRLSVNDIYETRVNPRRVEKNFTAPAAKVGSIIEYSYKITSAYYERMPGWEFQDEDYPCLWSEYKMELPSLLGYSSIIQGINPFFINKSEEGYARYNIKFRSENPYASQLTANINCATFKRRWVKKDVPAFNVEDYITTPSNYLDKIDFQLVKIYNNDEAQNGRFTWAELSDDLLDDKSFGYALLPSENKWMDKTLENVLGTEKDAVKKATLIYDYVAKNFSRVGDDDYYTLNLYDINKAKKGTVGDINLLLIAMLREADIKADPMILTTREVGFSHPAFPIIDKINYVICRCKVGGEIYNLDASNPYLGFGNLPSKCFNGYARTISENDTTAIYLQPDSIKEKRVTMVTIINDEKNKGWLSGNMQSLPGPLESATKRANIIRQGETDYFKPIRTAWGTDINIEKISVDSVRNPAIPLKIEIDFKIKNDPATNMIYFNPALFNGSFTSNPFESAERKYPVEMPYPLDQMYVMTMEIPEGYEVDELPKSTKALYNENEGFFLYQIARADNNIQFRFHIKLFKATFPASEYKDLRDFFAVIVKKQKEEIVFRKKK